MRRPLCRLIVALAAVVLLALGIGMGAGTTRAASAPTPTETPPATQTPYPTQTPAATYTPYPSPTVTHRPTLQLSASQGMPGATLIAVGSDFPDGGLVTLSWDGAYLARGTTDESGDVSITMKVPSEGAGAALGPHEIHAVGPNRTAATALFTVAQMYHPALALTLSHASATTGTVVTANTSGFAPGQTITFSWDRIGGTSVFAHGSVADDNGDTSADIILGIDPTPGVGTHRLYASGTTPTLSTSASFTVDPPPPACGGWGATVPWINWSVCLDPIGAVAGWLKDGAAKAGTAVGSQVASALVEQKDYTAVDQLKKPLGTTQMLAQFVFGVLFTVGITTWYYTRLGGAPAEEAVLQVVEGAAGFIMATGFPTFAGVYIAAVNWAGTQILANPGTDGGAIIGSALTALTSTKTLLEFAAFPPLVAIIGLFVVGALALLILIMVTRTILTMFGSVLYLAAPLALVCAATALTRGVARAWAGLWFSTTLVGVAYALALVAVRAMLTMLGGDPAYNDGLGLLVQGVAAIMVIYGAPRLCAYLVGRGGLSALGYGHTPGLRTALNLAMSAATGAAAGAAAGTAGGAAGDVAAPGLPTVTEMFPAADVIEAPSYQLLGAR